MTDCCAACFRVLQPRICEGEGPRVACDCTPPNAFRHLRGRYWSEAMPEQSNTREACLISKHGRPTLHLYGSVPR
jgi:hypothetical protein